MGDLSYVKAGRISLKKSFNEKWLQNIIEADPTIIGLGELSIIERERKQSSGGRIDFLFLNPETQTMYETEIMLGPTDESHIIRTIEYWDIERKRFPSKDHKAVIIAEEITNRFFNVIGLMNRSIPLIAIQLNALSLDGQVILNFTKVLDIYEIPEDEEDLGLEVDRQYWKNKSNPKSIALADQMIEMSKSEYADLRITYNKQHIALGTLRQNFLWLHPRKGGYCHFEIKLGKDNLDFTKSLLEGIGISFNNLKDDNLSISIQTRDLTESNNQIREMIVNSIKAFS
jgi:hypothetical protein